MNLVESLQSFEVQKFILDHEYANPAEVLLKHKTIGGVSASVIVDQIAGRLKSRVKIPLYYNTPGIIYPPSKNLEQSSSERTAEFKASLLACLGDTASCLDLTGGFGIDSYFLSKVFGTVVQVEPNHELLAFARCNHELLGANNIRHINHTAAGFLDSSQENFSVVYIDPSRRDQRNKRVTTLMESEPDVLALMNTIFQRSGYLLIKAAPMLDMAVALRELPLTSRVLVISVENECKELLFLLKKDNASAPRIEAINLETHNIQVVNFSQTEEREVEIQFVEPMRYLYEPNASLLKAGAFKLMTSRYNVGKVHPNTHLYTSTELVADFPGKIFEIIAHVKPDPKALLKFLPEGKANITTRNYPMDPATLKRATRLKDGGDKYLIGFTGKEKKYLVVAKRVS